MTDYSWMSALGMAFFMFLVMLSLLKFDNDD